MPEQLTREAVLALPAGREMDRLVGERLMGVHVKRKRHGRSGISEGGHWLYDLVIPGGVDEIDFVDGPEAAWRACPAYSTDIAAAWRVVEFESSLRRSLNPVRLSQTLKGWCCRIRTDHYKHVVADGETPMVAICRAALLATLA